MRIHNIRYIKDSIKLSYIILPDQYNYIKKNIGLVVQTLKKDISQKCSIVLDKKEKVLELTLKGSLDTEKNKLNKDIYYLAKKIEPHLDSIEKFVSEQIIHEKEKSLEYQYSRMSSRDFSSIRNEKSKLLNELHESVSLLESEIREIKKQLLNIIF
jgi:hypothetical protein